MKKNYSKGYTPYTKPTDDKFIGPKTKEQAEAAAYKPPGEPAKQSKFENDAGWFGAVDENLSAQQLEKFEAHFKKRYPEKYQLWKEGKIK